MAVTEEQQKEASKQISEKIAAAQALIAECEKISDEFDVGFSLNVAYGMGGHYYPALSDEELAKRKAADEWYDSSSGWVSSSASC